MKILVLNGGSSGLKASLREVDGAAALPSRAPEPLWDARVDWGRHPGNADIRLTSAGGRVEQRHMPIRTPADVLDPVLATLAGLADIDIVGHRVVHGGKAFREPARINREVKETIVALAQFAPEHNRLEAEAIEAAERALGPSVPQIAIFDTAFHATIPLAAAVYPGPYDWIDEGIHRYGFHGISHQYASRRAAEILGRNDLRLVSCHLGNGSSLAAVRDGRSIDTTMGFTPLEGVMMGTRSGSIDPGIVIYLVRNCGYSADQLDNILNRQSGLKGISGVSADMREVIAAMERGHERARLAFDLFVHRLCREIGGMVASLGGLDALVFTAGIGENSPPVRERVCEQFGFLGVKLDAAKNAGQPVDQDIAAPDSAVRVVVVHTDEDWEIARQCHRIANSG